jgi:trigger factor
LVFTVTVTEVPLIKLPTYRAITKTVKRRDPKPVTERMVEDSLEWLRQSRANFTSSPIGSVPGDVVTFDLQLSRNGVLVHNGSASHSRVKLGAMKLLPGMEEQLVGVRPGDTKRFELSIPQDFWNKDLAGTTVSASVAVKKVEIEVLPELNDAFAQSVGKFVNVAELTAIVRQGLEFEERERVDDELRRELVRTVAAQAEFVEPADLVDEELSVLVADLKRTVTEHGAPWDQYLRDIGKTEDEVKSSMRGQAHEQVRATLVLDAVAKAEGLAVTPDEVDREVKRFVAQFRSVREADKAIDPAALVSYTAHVLRRRKATEFLEQCASGSVGENKKT